MTSYRHSSNAEGRINSTAKKELSEKNKRKNPPEKIFLCNKFLISVIAVLLCFSVLLFGCTKPDKSKMKLSNPNANEETVKIYNSDYVITLDEVKY